MRLPPFGVGVEVKPQDVTAADLDQRIESLGHSRVVALPRLLSSDKKPDDIEFVVRQVDEDFAGVSQDDGLSSIGFQPV